MSDSNVTKEGIEVMPGQRWRDLDKRQNGRTVVVYRVEGGKAYVDGGSVKTRLSISRMHKHSTGFELVR